MKHADIIEHFGRFGKIIDCTFKQPGINRNTTLKRQWTRNDTYALITYENISEASKYESLNCIKFDSS